MKRIIFLIAIIAMTTACGTMRNAAQRFPQVAQQISFTPEKVAQALNEGKEVGDDVPPGFSSVWEEHNKIFPSKRNDPAWGWVLYDLDGDGLFEHIFHQSKEVKDILKLQKLAIKTGEKEWQIADDEFISEVEINLIDED